ncbi:hypothetical protein E2C01_098940 [Portunus trituberculatus]|uniref:Uncharacterized protein n=1 Tax=Portunus trituberculatus TaxID=210409 RepID=A0A5B7KDJ8_PORTR|nr:hypothetical protein [Portunus trituberculatus]
MRRGYPITMPFVSWLSGESSMMSKNASWSEAIVWSVLAATASYEVPKPSWAGTRKAGKLAWDLWARDTPTEGRAALGRSEERLAEGGAFSCAGSGGRRRSLLVRVTRVKPSF